MRFFMRFLVNCGITSICVLLMRIGAEMGFGHRAGAWGETAFVFAVAWCVSGALLEAERQPARR